jgi:hypothetical protein
LKPGANSRVTAAQALGRLEQQDRTSAARKVSRAHQPVVAAADDDAVELRARG